MGKRVLLLGVVVMFCLCNNAWAGRPLSTDDAGTVAPGHLEFEAGVEYLKQPNNDRETAVPVSLKTGVIWDRLDFGVEVPYLFIDPDAADDENGFGDLEAKAKLRFLDESDSFPALAFSAGIKTTTGDEDKGLGSGKTDEIFVFIATKGLDKLTLDVNAGYNAIGEEDHVTVEQDTISLGLAGEYAVTKLFCLVAEVTGEIYVEDNDEDNPCEVLVGATYELPFGAVVDGGGWVWPH